MKDGQFYQKQKISTIPLISKRMNSVEKYISNFSSKALSLAKLSTEKHPEKQKMPHHMSHPEIINQYKSADITPYNQVSDRSEIHDHCCLEYNSINQKKSEERLQTLTKLEKQYGLLKEKMRPKQLSPLSPHHHYETERKGKDPIALEDIKRELKHAVINDNGKKYFADLYLLKKGRDEIINSLSEAGKSSLRQNRERSYQQKVEANQHDFIKDKIYQDRETKKNKMLKGRNLHWNVYYDMLALSASQKKKLKGVCKFTTTFGII